MKILQVAFLFLFNYLDSLPKLYYSYPCLSLCDAFYQIDCLTMYALNVYIDTVFLNFTANSSKITLKMHQQKDLLVSLPYSIENILKNLHCS